MSTSTSTVPGAMARFPAMVARGAGSVDPASLDWDALGFAPVVTTAMTGSVCGADGVWDEPETVPSGSLILPPHATALNYGQGLFEGLKARRGVDGRVRLFRPRDNARRMAAGAARFMLAVPGEELFVRVVLDCVRANLDWVPPAGKGSLYLRPLLLGTGRTIGLGPSPETLFMVYANPVGLYFKGLAPITVLASEDHQRAAERGTGNVKAAGNYAPCFQPVAAAKAAGFADLLYLDQSGKRVEEVGSANFCAVKGKRLLVADSPSILPGITRDSVERLARERFGMEVERGALSLERVLGLGEWAAEGPADEAFCTGTAAIVSPIGGVSHGGRVHAFGGGQVGAVTRNLHDELDGIQTGRLPDTRGWTSLVD
ncbi:MAG: branched-chain amino acid aminotransferase [Spirochaetaceae bacterium]|nr:branched-chain amino acid aminotransferase [Spirochaetaceae bacterium]